MSETAFCYHCRTHHPKEEMRLIDTKAGKRWRREVTAMNKAEAQRKARLVLNGRATPP
jgi:hypothetical protein